MPIYVWLEKIRVSFGRWVGVQGIKIVLLRGDKSPNTGLVLIVVRFLLVKGTRFLHVVRGARRYNIIFVIHFFPQNSWQPMSYIIQYNDVIIYIYNVIYTRSRARGSIYRGLQSLRNLRKFMNVLFKINYNSFEIFSSRQQYTRVVSQLKPVLYFCTPV